MSARHKLTALAVSSLILAAAAPAMGDPPRGPGDIAIEPKRPVAPTYWCVDSDGTATEVDEDTLCIDAIKLKCEEDADRQQSVCVPVSQAGRPQLNLDGDTSVVSGR